MRTLLVFCFFFFSSRRRHTRCSRDWSSDVCSSDLWRARMLRADHASETARTTQPAVPVACDMSAFSPDERRSEEHTSELQSRLHLVCRLLLEKKKKTRT